MFAKVRAQRHERNSSGATTASSNVAPLVSPLQMNFDFELPASRSQSPYRISGESLRRPSTSDGVGNYRKSGLGLTAAPPVLPPIPRIASRYERSMSDRDPDSRLEGSRPGTSSGWARDESDNVSAFSFGSRKSQLLHPAASFEHPIDLMPTTMSRPASDAGLNIPGQDAQRPSTSGGSTPRMESSLFPPKSAGGSPMLPPINSGPPMSRAFIDSRDKPYSHPGPTTRPSQIQQSQSVPYMSPNMQSLQSPASYSSYSSQSPMSPQMATPSPATLSPNLLLTPSSANSLRAPKISGARLSPSASVEDLRALVRSPTGGTMASMGRSPTNGTMATGSTTAPTNYSGSTALPSPHSSVAKAYSPSAHSPLARTIGTPYGTTSSSFPLPQHVATRPKTAGASASVAGVNVPTHHTSTPRPDSVASSSSAKADKRKTRLLNPMALLARRKSGQDSEVASAHERSAAAQAYARQKSVAAVGVSKMPEDFDPRIRGKVVHDFSAPRARRQFSYNDADNGMLSPAEEARRPMLQSSASSAPFVPALQQQQDFSSMFAGSGAGQPTDMLASTHSKNTSESSSSAYNRRSMNSPSMFRELLNTNDEIADGSGKRRESSINAERLENKGFLQRVSQHSSNMSQESAVLPPFARRSQYLDASQAALFFQDDGESKRSSDPSSGKERDSNLSSVSSAVISPVTARSSSGGGGNQIPIQGRELRDSLGQSLSPVSPRSPPDKGLRPFSAISAKAVDLPAQGQRMEHLAMESSETRERSESAATARPFASSAAAVMVARPPGVERIAEQGSPIDGGWSPNPNRNSAQAPEAVVVVPECESSAAAPRMLSIPIPDRNSSLGTTPELTPEIAQAELMAIPTASRSPGPAKIVEKRASAVGHAARQLSGVPKHQVSNASRFSFQFGESRAEEEALEEKHRKIKGRSLDSEASTQQLQRQRERAMSPDEEEDDFDESALDDMDEFEQAEHGLQHAAPPLDPSGPATNTVLSGIQAARKQLQAAPSESDDDGSVYDEDDIPDVTHERELTYAEHPAFRAHSALASTHSHSRDVSQQTVGGWGGGSGVEQYMRQQEGNYSPESARRGRGRGASDASALTVHTANLPMTGGAAAGNHAGTFMQDTLSPNESHIPGGYGGARPRSGFYMQPKAAGYSPQAGSPQTEKPPLPHRDSGNSERNRVASGMSFTSGEAAAGGRHGSPSESRTLSAGGGLGLSGLGSYNFRDSPDLSLNDSRPTSGGTADRDNANRLTKDSETIPQRMSTWAELDKHASMGTSPLQGARMSEAGYLSSPESNGRSAAYRGAIGNNIRARNNTINQNMQYAASDSGDEAAGRDDLYYDDGGFEQDIRQPVNRHDSVDEDEFDDSAFLQRSRLNGMMGGGGHHQRDVSGVSFASLGGDGPYPSFAMGANPVKTRQRQSQLLLEDLPLQGPVDPKLIPQRNPSEDAKRLGLSNKVPPLPAQEGSKEAMMRMQANLQAYHAALADAANKAASEGRFQRQLSVASMTRSLSTYSNVVEDDGSRYSHDDTSRYSHDDTSRYSHDDRSHYSKDEHGDEAGGLAVPNGEGGLGRSASKDTSGSRMDQSHTYSPPKLDFDFGFGAGLMDDGPEDDLGLDDDMVAAANGEVLASDDEGFYGQEFGFYANARPNSGEVQAINGGFFGDDGDDGLARNKSLKEPNLTPITERSEFSTRNSFINLGHGAAFGLPSAGLHGPASPALARLPVSPLVENEATSFDQLRKLRANAFGGSNGSLGSDYGPGKGPGSYAWQAAHAHSPSLSAKSPASAQGYFGSAVGGTPVTLGYSTGSNGSSDPSSARQQAQHDSPQRHHFQESPQSATANSGLLPFAGAAADPDATPRKQGVPTTAEPVTVRKVSAPAYMNGGQTHARKGSDSVTYVKEQDPSNGGQPRWVLERRRTSEQGQLELVGREVVQGGWI
ncbi:hypothetical protein LTR85_010258 [Meristemomyces frigidus]|nr:hypothetical protein LTR85_010258 [Meristemomyces frigidus]